jgi:hypothetical protein
LLKGIGGGSAAVIQGSDRDVPLWSTSLESPKATRCSARSKGYHFPCKQFSSATILAECAVTGGSCASTSNQTDKPSLNGPTGDPLWINSSRPAFTPAYRSESGPLLSEDMGNDHRKPYRHRSVWFVKSPSHSNKVQHGPTLPSSQIF